MGHKTGKIAVLAGVASLPSAFAGSYLGLLLKKFLK